MNFIKEIFNGKTGKEDKEIHRQFQKFSKGEFKNRALIEVKKEKGNYIINTSPEFVNEIVKTLAGIIGDKKTKVKGAIVSTLSLEDHLKFKDKKQFQGVKRYIIDDEMSGEDIKKLIEDFPKAFFGLSFSINPEDNKNGKKYKISTKPKAPKSAKPSPKGDKEPKADFCKITTDDSEIAHEFIFEKEEIENVKINHTFQIDSLEIPEEAKKSGDFKKMREEALRKGKVIRQGEINGEKIKEESDLLG